MQSLARRYPLFILILLTLLFSAFAPCPAIAQENGTSVSASAPVPEEITATHLEGRLKGVQESTTLDEASKSVLVPLYTQALEHLKSADDWRAKADQFEQLRVDAPALIEARQIELESASNSLSEDGTALLADADALKASEIEGKVAEAESALDVAQTAVAELEQESSRRAERRRQLPGLQTEARARLDAARALLNTAPAATESNEITAARNVLTRAKIILAEQELRSHTEELSSYDARGRLLALRVDLATRNVQRAKSLAERWREKLAIKRQEEARQAEIAAREAILEAANAPIEVRQLVQDLATENADLTREQTGATGLIQKMERSDARREAVEAHLNQLESEFTRLKKKVDAAGSSAVIGLLLRGHRQSLPDVRTMEREIAQRQEEIATVQIDQIQAEEDRRELADIDSKITSVLNELSTDLSDEQRETIRKILRQYYETKRNLLYEKTSFQEKYYDKLIDLDTSELQLIDKVKQMDTYIQERVLWVRSGSPLGLSLLKDSRAALLWLLDARQVDEINNALWTDAKANPVPTGLTTLLLLILFLARRPFRRRLRQSAELVKKRGNIQLRPTFNAMVYTFILSLDLPLALALVGWRLSASYASTDYTSAAGNGLFNAALVLWSLDFTREVLKRSGLGVAHFNWSEKACRGVYKTLLWLEILSLPLVYVISALSQYGDNHAEDSLGRLCFMVSMLMLTLALHQLLRKRNGSLFDLIELARGKSSLYARRFGYLIGLGIPLTLFVVAGLGFYYSALHIASQLHATMLCVLGLILVIQLLLRWMTITRKRLAREQARKRREAARDSTSSATDAALEKAQEINLARVDAQSMRLIKSGFVACLAVAAYLIWSPDLPALSVLDNQTLWETYDTVQREVLNPDTEETEILSEPVVVPITLRDAVFFLFIVGITFIAVQNLPGLLEIVLLERLTLIAGERYAVKSIVAYVLTVAGGIWAFTVIGLSWSKIQWLVAAVGLGLGFGLQEIFANLVSGLIILFERPIRVGDTVTVGDISGTVSRIRIRATWITAFNRQELIVPNKEFVTGRLVNWTLSDQVLRVEIPVGIAYGSDVELARRLMLEVANAHELVLEDPKPVVYFRGFGDSSLDFELRVHSPDLDSYLPIKDAMHTQIDAAFRAHHIEIPFPQRDIHVRSMDIPMPPGGHLESTS